MEIERKKSFLINASYLVVCLAIAYLLLRYAAPVLMPFLIALVVAALLQPAIRFLNKKCKLKKKLAATIMVVVFFVIAIALLSLISVKLFVSLKSFVLRLPGFYSNSVAPALTALSDNIEQFFSNVNPELASVSDELFSRVSSSLSSYTVTLSTRAFNFLTNFATALPGFLISVLICVISTFFIAIDYVVIWNFILRQFAKKNRKLLSTAKNNLKTTLGRYIRSYSLILLITFLELSVGFLIVGIKNPFLTAALIAIFDILPVVGTGTVLIPWTVICLLQANYLRAVGILAIYLVVLTVRNIIEPKIVGQNVGLHPVVTLVSMVAGTALFGGIGLIGVPVAVAVIKMLNDQGLVHFIKPVRTYSGNSPGCAEEKPFADSAPPPASDPPAEDAPEEQKK